MIKTVIVLGIFLLAFTVDGLSDELCFNSKDSLRLAQFVQVCGILQEENRICLDAVGVCEQKNYLSVMEIERLRESLREANEAIRICREGLENSEKDCLERIEKAVDDTTPSFMQKASDTFIKIMIGAAVALLL